MIYILIHNDFQKSVELVGSTFAPSLLQGCTTYLPDFFFRSRHRTRLDLKTEGQRILGAKERSCLATHFLLLKIDKQIEIETPQVFVQVCFSPTFGYLQ